MKLICRFTTLTLALILLSGSLCATDLASFRSQAKQLAARENGSYTPDTTWNIFVNLAVNAVSQRCSCVVKEDTITTTPGQRKDALNADFSYILDVYSNKLNKSLKQIPYNQVGIIDPEEQNITEFAIEGDNIAWHRFPATADEMILTYTPDYKKLTADTMVTNLPGGYDLAVMYWTVSELFNREKNWSVAAYWKQLAKQEIAEVSAARDQDYQVRKLKRDIP